jgi:hypothetical protein
MQVLRAFPALSLLPPVLLLAAALLGPVSSEAATAGSGSVATEARAVSDFEAIAISGAMSLEVRQTGKESVTVTADDNLLPLIETVVEDGRSGRTLHIRTRRGESYRSRQPVKVVVEVVRLTSLAMSGSGDTRVETLKTPRLRASLSGSGDLRLTALSTEEFDVGVSGSADVQAAGQATRVKLRIAGSGDAKLGELTAEDVTVSIAGSGDATVHADKALSVMIAGSGDVRYRGAASDVRSKVAGSGGVRKF